MSRITLALAFAVSIFAGTVSAHAATVPADVPLPLGTTVRYTYLLGNFTYNQQLWYHESAARQCNYKKETIVFYHASTRQPVAPTLITNVASVDANSFFSGCRDNVTGQVDLERIYAVTCTDKSARVWEYQWRGRTPNSAWFKYYVCSPNVPRQARWISPPKPGIAVSAPDMGAPDAGE